LLRACDSEGVAAACSPRVEPTPPDAPVWPGTRGDAGAHYEPHFNCSLEAVEMSALFSKTSRFEIDFHLRRCSVQNPFSLSGKFRDAKMRCKLLFLMVFLFVTRAIFLKMAYAAKQ